MHNYFLDESAYVAFEHQFLNRLKKSEGVMLRSGSADTTVAHEIDQLVNELQNRGGQASLVQHLWTVRTRSPAEARLACAEASAVLQSARTAWEIVPLLAPTDPKIPTVLNALGRTRVIRAMRRSGVLVGWFWPGTVLYLAFSAVLTGLTRAMIGTSDMSSWSMASLVGLSAGALAAWGATVLYSQGPWVMHRTLNVLGGPESPLQQRAQDELASALLDGNESLPVAVIAPDWPQLDPASVSVVQRALGADAGKHRGTVLWIAVTQGALESAFGGWTAASKQGRSVRVKPRATACSKLLSKVSRMASPIG